MKPKDFTGLACKMMKNKAIDNEVVILYKEDIFSAWTNIKSDYCEEMAYFLKVKEDTEDLYFMLGKPGGIHFL